VKVPRFGRTGSSAGTSGPRGSTGRGRTVRLAATALALGAVLVVLLVALSGGEGSSDDATPTTTTPTITHPLSTAPFDEPAVRTPTDLADGRSLGSPDAPVQLDLWSDYQCPACDAFAGSVTPELVERYIRPGKARLTIHDMISIGEESLGAAISARCAEKQGKFWEYHDLLFANQAPEENSGTFTHGRSRQFAAALDLDLDLFTVCLADTTVEDAVLAESKQGLSQGVKETPTLYVNGKIANPANSWGPVSTAIEAALGKGS
jgi:protein-disulfide isomerase